MDYSALPVRVTSYIGDSAPLDISANCLRVGPIKTSAIDLGGYVKTTATLVLVGEESLLETRFNARWGIGSRVVIQVFFEGQWITHRTLRVLDAFYDDGRSERSIRPGSPALELELGDLFALKDARFPNPGDIDIPALQNSPDVNVWLTVNYWLEVFDLPTITFLPGDEVPGDRIATTGLYTGGSSVMEHIGKILFCNSRFVLWVDALERVRVRRVGKFTSAFTFANDAERVQPYTAFNRGGLAVTNADLEFIIAEDDALINERARSEREKPAGTVQVVGSSLFRYGYQDPPPSLKNTIQDGVTVSETISVDTGVDFLSRTTTKTGTMYIAGLVNEDQEDEGDIGQYSEITVETYGGATPERANPNPNLKPYPGLDAHLQSQTITVREQRRNPDTGDLDPLAITKRIKTTYRYRNTSQSVNGVFVEGVEIKSILEVTEALPEAVAGEPAPTLKIEQTREMEWRELSQGNYLFTESIVRPADKASRRYASNTTTVGESTPPGTKWAPPSLVENWVPMYGEARFNYPPGNPNLDHPRSYNAGAYLDNNRAALLLADLMGQLLIARAEAQNIAFRPTAEWLADPIPAPWVVVGDSLYLLDIPVVVFGDRRTYLGGTGLFFGGYNLGTEETSAPYEDGYLLWAYDNETLVTADIEGTPIRING